MGFLNKLTSQYRLGYYFTFFIFMVVSTKSIKTLFKYKSINKSNKVTWCLKNNIVALKRFRIVLRWGKMENVYLFLTVELSKTIQCNNFVQKLLSIFEKNWYHIWQFVFLQKLRYSPSTNVIYIWNKKKQFLCWLKEKTIARNTFGKCSLLSTWTSKFESVVCSDSWIVLFC